MKSLDWIVSEAALRRLAGERAFLRGQAYFAQERVRSLAAQGARCGAVVCGQQGEYRVELWAEDEDLACRCSCPVGSGERPCKHAVAAALAFLQRKEGRELTLDDAAAQLAELPRHALQALVLSRALFDEGLRAHLILSAAVAGPAAPHRPTIRAAIDRAVQAEGPVPFAALSAYVQRFAGVIDALAELVAQGRRKPDLAEAAVEMCEHALWALLRAQQAAGAGRGRLRTIARRLQLLHQRACEAARPDSEKLAERLLQLELAGVLHGAAGLYAGILGEPGLAAYGQLAQAAWAALPPLAPGQIGESTDPSPAQRARLGYVMEGLCWLRGDLPALVEVKRRDLSTPQSFVEIAAIYRELGLPEEARRWIERGRAAFPGP